MPGFRRMSIERMHSIHRSPVSFFDSNWEVGSWDDFGQTLRSMEKRMREMDRQFEQMFNQFMRLTPIGETRKKERRSGAFRSSFFDDDFDMCCSPGVSAPEHPALTDVKRGESTSRRSLLARQGSWDFGFPDTDVQDPVITTKEGKRMLNLRYDVRQFRPEEITVKTMDNRLEVKAKHESGDERHKVYREYHRVFTLPEGVEPETLSSTFSPEGILSIEAPMPEPVPAIKELPKALDEPVAIPIQHMKSVEAVEDK
jgi:HSP20 family molecular chaperone IbpA